MKSTHGLPAEIPIFVGTNLGTHLAVSIPPDITAGHLKCRLAQEHSSCFPNLGEIKVHSLLLKKRSHFYHLPDAMPLKCAFRGLTGTWFLEMQASRLPDMALSHRQPLKSADLQKSLLEERMSKSRENKPSTSSGSDITDCTESEIVIGGLRRKTHIMESFSGLNSKGGMQMEGNSTMGNQNAMNLLSANPLESKEPPDSSEVVSVTGIISRYFYDSDDVDSCSKRSKPQFEETPTLGASDCLVNQVRLKRTVEADTDTVCSNNNVVIAGVDQFTASKVRRAAKRGYCRNKTSRSRRKFSPSASNKLRIGEKMIQAARNISISASRRKLYKPQFMSRCGNLVATESVGLVRSLVFEIDNLDD